MPGPQGVAGPAGQQRIEEAIIALTNVVAEANATNEKLQRRIYYLTVATAVLTLMMAVYSIPWAISGVTRFVAWAHVALDRCC